MGGRDGHRDGVVWQQKQKPDVYGPEVYTKFLKRYSNNRLIDVQNDPDERNPVPPDRESAEAAASGTLLQAALRSLQTDRE